MFNIQHAFIWLLWVAPFVGSFIGLVAIRLPHSRAVHWGRSRCDGCGHVLAFPDLIPMLSAVMLGFRCRYCVSKIDVVHFFCEAVAVAIVLSAGFVFEGWALAISCVLGWMLLTLAVIDWRHFLLPNVLTFGVFAAGVATIFVFYPSDWLGHLAGAAAGFALLFGISEIYRAVRLRDGLGMGDAKLLGAIGAWVSITGIFSVLTIASILGLAVSVALKPRVAQVEMSTKVPFGTYLAISGWVVWLYGPWLVGDA
jgi:leader peptidase (prepilin peptidase)/N-methyltransferase